jgi:predicted Zn-dependent peptidase
MKKYISAQLEMEYDSLSSRLWRLIEGETYLGRYLAVEEVLKRAEAITTESISKFIRERISFSGSALALGGNVKGLKLSDEVKAFCGFVN